MIPLHPRIVHFPIAFLIGAAVFGILALIFKNKRTVFKEVLFWNLALGIPGTVLAIISGLGEEETLTHNEAIHSLMETHELLGFIFSGVFLSIFIWMILRKSKLQNLEFTIIVTILVLAAGLMGYSAHLGGRMVYEQGAGVIPMKKVILQEEGGQHHHHNGEESVEHNMDDHDHSYHHNDE